MHDLWDDDRDDCGCDRDDEDRPRLHRRRLTMARGDTWTYAFQVVRDVATGFLYTVKLPLRVPRGSVPVDITSAKLEVTLKRFASDNDAQAVARLSSPSSGVVFTNATSGIATATMAASNTVGFPDTATKLVYDIQLILGGVVTTVEIGELWVGADVTQATT